ncbi:MAG: hypothetical protein Q9P01_14165 [Anaerolineae bacterium]|nr:hypothetical protein [Anaerolineae bacterium]
MITTQFKLSYPLSGRFEYRVRSAEKQWVVGYWNSLQLTDTLNMEIPVSLRAGQYQLVLVYRGALLPATQEATVFTVMSIVDSLIQRGDSPDRQEKLKLLSLKHQEFAEINDNKLQHYWHLLRFMTQARNTSELLPTWAVTENALSCSIIFAGAVKQIILYPEKASHKGLKGVGKTPLIINSEMIYAYVQWESLNKYQAAIRLWLPQGSPLTFWDLEPDDMYPVYYSKRDLQFYAKEGYPTPEEIRDRDLIEVSFENSLPCEIYPSQRFLQHALKAHYVVDRRYFIAKLEYDDKYHINKPQASDYRLAIDNFLKIESIRANRKQILRFLEQNSKYRTILETFEDTLKSHTIIGNTTLSRVTQRFLQSALVWSDNKEHNYFHLERLVMLLSLALRLRAYYPHLYKEIDVLIPENDLIEIITLIEHLAPELFIWSLTWVELFAIHAIS